MGVRTKIEWTDVTWNPTTGCDRISPGCDHCYALTMANRLRAMGSPKYEVDGDPQTSGPGFGVALHEDVLSEPLGWRKPRRVFVGSMADIAHAHVPREFLVRVFAVMVAARKHSFQVLTKRPKRLERLLSAAWFRDAVLQQAAVHDPSLGAGSWPAQNVWIGTSIESDGYCWRADAVRRTPAAVRFLSLEPLLGPVPSLDLRGIDWVIVGGESGHGSRPMHPAWARQIRDRCAAGDVPFFFKQWGSWQLVTEEDPAVVGLGDQYLDRPRRRVSPEGSVGELSGWRLGDAVMMRVRPEVAGRRLDGRLWDDFPVAQSTAPGVVS